MTTENRPSQTAVPCPAGAAQTTSSPPAERLIASMDRYLFFGRVIDNLARGSVVRTWSARLLRTAAAGIAFAGLIVLFKAWQFTTRQEAAGIIGGIVYMLFLVAAIYMVVHATIIRAGHTASLPDGEFILIPLCAVLSLLVGEAYAAFSVSISLGGGLLIWFTRESAYELLSDVSAFVPAGSGTDFLAGILFMIRGLVRAAAVLAAGYLASELFLLIGKTGERQRRAAAS